MRWKNPGEASGITFFDGSEPRVTSEGPPARDGHGRSGCDVALKAADGVSLHGVLHAGPGLPHDWGFIVGHGFTQHTRKPAMRRILRRLAAYAPVLGVDFRGHGRSRGRSTVGIAEALDIAAALEYLRGLGCSRVVSVGFSLGASVALRQTALAACEDRPDAVVIVSGPARWWVRDTSAMRRVHWLVEQPHGRLSARLLGVRLGEPWDGVPESPIELARHLSPTPSLLVHGERDQYFSVSDAVALHEAGGGELWLEPSMGHAERAATPGLVDRIAEWALDRVAPPEHPALEKPAP